MPASPFPRLGGFVDDHSFATLLPLLLAAFISVVVLLAVVRVFSIDATLKEILAELRMRREVEDFSEEKDKSRPLNLR
jgi:hypothetical protein